MSKLDDRNALVIALAYWHRYIFVVLIILVPCFLADDEPDFLLGLGIGCILYAAYSLVGYLFRWKHIYCSYQNAYHQKMTPLHIKWHKMKKTDAYGIPILFGILGIACVLVAVFYGS